MGGGVWNEGPSHPIHFVGCEFIGNTAHRGGAFCIYASGLSFTQVSSSLFVDNEAWTGGAVFSKSTLYVDDSIFESNTATGTGGALECWFDCSIEDLTANTWEDNEAGVEGGAIHIEYESCDSIGVGNTFIDNTPDDCFEMVI